MKEVGKFVNGGTLCLFEWRIKEMVGRNIK